MTTQPRITPDRAVLIGMMLAATAFCRDLSYDFVMDDVPLILLNQTLASWRNWKTIFLSHIFSPMGPVVPAVHYRPVYVLWLLLNQQLFGAVVPWWHLTSLLLHLLVIFMVYRLGLRVVREPWTAALGALLFAFHPIHVESVAYVSDSTDLLAALFALVSLLSYVRFREEGAGGACYGISIFAAALAILSKEAGAMLPWMFVAYEGLRAPARDTDRADRDWKRFGWTLSFFAVAAGYAVVRTLLFGRNVVPGGERLGGLQNVPLVLAAYLRNMLWPVRLSVYYPLGWVLQWTPAKAVAIALATLSAAFLWKLYRDRPGLRLQLLWAATLVIPPLTGVFIFAQDDWVHDRHMYLASVPFCLIIAALLREPKLPRRASALVSSLILAILFFETAVQLPRFHDEITLYRSAVEAGLNCTIAHSHYAGALWGSGHQGQALQEYRLTTELSPESAFFHEEYGAALARMGQDDEATVQYTKALQWARRPTPLRGLVLYALATIEVRHSKFGAGADHMREALRIAPEAQGYHAMLAQALRQEGYTQEADEQMQLEIQSRQAARRRGDQ